MPVLAMIAFLIGGLAASWTAGAIAGLAVTGLGVLAAMVSVLTIRRLGWGEVALPFLSSIVWSVLLLPLHLATKWFAAPACIGSGLLFSMALWSVKCGRSSPAWLMLPAAIWCYEMLPLSIPGPLDDLLALGGQGTLLVLQWLIPKRTPGTLPSSGATPLKLASPTEPGSQS